MSWFTDNGITEGTPIPSGNGNGLTLDTGNFAATPAPAPLGASATAGQVTTNPYYQNPDGTQAQPGAGQFYTPDAAATSSTSGDPLMQKIQAALSAAQSTDDPNYWYQTIKNRGAADGSDWNYWLGRINQGDGAAAVKNGTVQPFQDGAAATQTPVGIGDPRLNAQVTPFVAPTFEQAQNEPGYKFALDQGLGAMQNSASAKGLLHSGATLKGLNDYASNSAAKNYNDVFNRALTTNQSANNTALGYGNLGLGVGNLGLNTQNQGFNQGLQTFLANTGQQNTQTNQGLNYLQILAGAGGNYANNAGSLLTGQGNANAAGTVGSANAVNTALGNVGNNAQQATLAHLLGWA